MAYILTGIVSLSVAILSFLLKTVFSENKKLKEEKEAREAAEKEAAKKREDALEEGVVCLLRVKLIEYHKRYMDSGEISSHGYENWNLMYEAYQNLGGNGMIKHMKQDIDELHIR